MSVWIWGEPIRAREEVHPDQSQDQPIKRNAIDREMTPVRTDEPG